MPPQQGLRHTYLCFVEVEPPRDCGVETAADLPCISTGSPTRSTRSSGPWPASPACSASAASPAFRSSTIWPFSERPRSISGRMEADPDIDWVGINAYRNKEITGRSAKRSRYLAGHSRLPYRPRVRLRYLEPPPEDLPARGTRIHHAERLHERIEGFNFYMLVERERWQGSPVTRHGTVSPEYAAFYERFSHLLGDIRFTNSNGIPVAYSLQLRSRSPRRSTLNAPPRPCRFAWPAPRPGQTPHRSRSGRRSPR